MATVIETRPLVETRPYVDAEQDDLAVIDAAYARAFGPDMGTWGPEIRAMYDEALQAVYARYPQAVTT